MDPKDQYINKLRNMRLFGFSRRGSQTVKLATLGPHWTPLMGVTGIEGCSPMLPDGLEHTSLSLFYHRADTDAFPVHDHEQRETLYVLSGAYYIEIEGEGRVYETGESVAVEPHMEHWGYPVRDALLACTYEPALPYADL